MGLKFDFGGWATKNNLRCSDGRTIRKDAFKDNDGQTVPLVWQHRHDDPTNVLGHALLENRDDGVFAYCTFNDTEWGQHAKALVEHGDVTALSIYANRLKQHGGDVLHGAIKEVSLVLAGANPGALIVDIPSLAHSEGSEDEVDDAMIFTGEDLILHHSDSEEKEEDSEDEKENESVKKEQKEKTVKDVFDELTEEQKQVVYFMIGQALEDAEAESEDEKFEKEDEVKHADDSEKKEKTVKDVFDELTEEQKQVVYFMIGKALEDAKNNDEDKNNDEEVEHYDFEGENVMKHNVFDSQTAPANYLSHSDEEQILMSAKKLGSLKAAIEAYAEENALMHEDEPSSDPAVVSGFDSYPLTPGTGVEALFPEYKNVRPGAPELVTNDQSWVKAVLGKVHKSPFSRIRTSQVDLRGIEEIRARGYKKGKEKALAGQYAVAKRATDPQTIFVRSALNRDDQPGWCEYG